ncbi:uncharacterized protein LOC127750896, partial [Frankliniella occidentalis]|uniref:Uncharacterized protein LOC127750896 n=1 Tax=Frankliniella occidentalis TaxID=133901 RepID=A0A9C6XSI3_FRAOC
MPTATVNMKMLSISIPRPSKQAGDDVSWSSTSPSESPLSNATSPSSAPAGPHSPWSFVRDGSYRSCIVAGSSRSSTSWAARRRQSAQETSTRRRPLGAPTVAPSSST